MWTAIIFLHFTHTFFCVITEKWGRKKEKKNECNSALLSSYKSLPNNKKTTKKKKCVKCNTISHMHVFIHPRSLLYLPSVIFYFLQNGEQKIKKQKKNKYNAGKCVTRKCFRFVFWIISSYRLNHFDQSNDRLGRWKDWVGPTVDRRLRSVWLEMCCTNGPAFWWGYTFQVSEVSPIWPVERRATDPFVE